MLTVGGANGRNVSQISIVLKGAIELILLSYLLNLSYISFTWLFKEKNTNCTALG